MEGNTTFYSEPAPTSVLRWRDAVPADFRFCFKLPRTITHERMLRESGLALSSFLKSLEPLRDHLGPFLVQLPPAFGPRRLPDLEAFLAALPRELQWAVELRHRAFFDDDALARRCDALLAARGCDRVVMDTRALRSGDPAHPEVVAALHQKPDLPVRPEPVGRRPMIRWVGHPEPRTNEPFLDDWAARLAAWIARGLEPVFFVHTASNRRTPETARSLHERVAGRVDVGTLPPFPGEAGARAGDQLELL